jgi:hypothetical protein
LWWTKWLRDRFFFEYFGFLSYTLHKPSVLICTYMLLLPEGQTGEAWGKVKVKVEFTLEQATKAQRGKRYIALLFLQPRR